MQHDVGNGVIIDDRYCVKTQAEVDAILNEVARIYAYYRQKEALDRSKLGDASE